MEGEAHAQLRAYRQHAVQALVELQANPHVAGPLLYALVTQLAQDHAEAAPDLDALAGAGSHSANPLRPPARGTAVPDAIPGR